LLKAHQIFVESGQKPAPGADKGSVSELNTPNQAGRAPAPVAPPVVPRPLPRRSRTAPLPPPPPVRDRNKVAAAEDPLAKGTTEVDMNALARTAGQLGQALEAMTPLVDMGSNTADAVAFTPDAVQTALGRLPRGDADRLATAVEGATKAGRVLGGVGAAIAAKDLFQAVYPQLDVAAASEALCNLALGLATVGEGMLASPAANAALRTVGGLAGLASSLFAIARDIADVRENGFSFSNVLGLLGNALTGAGSALLLIPGMQVIGGALIGAGAALNVVRLAHDNWDALKGATDKVATRMGNWLSTAFRFVTGPPAAPAAAPAPA
jgi:hypothetical protein